MSQLEPFIFKLVSYISEFRHHATTSFHNLFDLDFYRIGFSGLQLYGYSQQFSQLAMAHSSYVRTKNVKYTAYKATGNDHYLRIILCFSSAAHICFNRVRGSGHLGHFSRGPTLLAIYSSQPLYRNSHVHACTAISYSQLATYIAIEFIISQLASQLASQYTQIHLDAIRVNFGPFLGHPVFMGHRGHSRVNKRDPVATLICTIANGLWQPMHKHTLTRTHQWLQLYPTRAYTRYFTGQGCPMRNYIANYKYPCR